MRWFVLCIVGGVYEQNSVVKNVRVDDWTAKRGITVGNRPKRTGESNQ